MSINRYNKPILPISEIVPNITGKFFAHNSVLQKIYYNWHIFVGEEYAKVSKPIKLENHNGNKASSILTISTTNPALSLLLSGMERQIVSRIHSFFGFQAVGRVRITVDLRSVHQDKNIIEKKALPKILLDQGSAIRLNAMLNTLPQEEMRHTLHLFINAFCDWQ